MSPAVKPVKLAKSVDKPTKLPPKPVPEEVYACIPFTGMLWYEHKWNCEVHLDISAHIQHSPSQAVPVAFHIRLCSIFCKSFCLCGI